MMMRKVLKDFKAVCAELFVHKCITVPSPKNPLVLVEGESKQEEKNLIRLYPTGDLVNIIHKDDQDFDYKSLLNQLETKMNLFVKGIDITIHTILTIKFIVVTVILWKINPEIIYTLLPIDLFVELWQTKDVKAFAMNLVYHQSFYFHLILWLPFWASYRKKIFKWILRKMAQVVYNVIYNIVMSRLNKKGVTSLNRTSLR